MKLQTQKTDFLYRGIFLFLMLLKYGYYGFEYFPVMDDWIQYGAYSLVDNPFVNLILKTKMYTIRPLAAFTDIYILGKLWNHLGVVLFVMTLMHFASGYYISRVFRYNGIKTGYVFLLIYGLLPFGSEATYWVSASSRILMSLFFTSAGLFYLCKYIYESQKKRYLLLFFSLLLLSVGFYESVVILGFIAVVFIVLPHFKRFHVKVATLVALIPFGIIAYYYNIFSNEGQLVGRATLVNSDSTKDFNVAYEAIYELVKNSDIYFYTRSLYRGFFVLLDQQAWIFMLLVITTGIAVFFVSLGAPRENKFFANIKKILIGVILALAPFLIFLPLSMPWISFRNAFTSFIGLAIVVEGILDIFTKDFVFKKAKGVVLAVVSASFIVMNVSELTDYKNVSSFDKKVCEEIVLSSKGTGLYEGDHKGFLFNSEHSYSQLNKNYHEHINSVTNSTWSLTGAVRAIANQTNIKNITPVFVNEPIKINPEDYTNFVLLGIENDKGVSLLKFKKNNKYLYYLYRTDGRIYGEIEYKYEHAFFRKYDRDIF